MLLLGHALNIWDDLASDPHDSAATVHLLDSSPAPAAGTVLYTGVDIYRKLPTTYQNLTENSVINTVWGLGLGFMDRDKIYSLCIVHW